MDEHDLVRAIAERPDDDDLRLRFADRIEASDPARARRTRQDVHVGRLELAECTALARGEPALDEASVARSERGSLAQIDARRWCAELAQLGAVIEHSYAIDGHARAASYSLDHGFVDGIMIPAIALVRNAAALEALPIERLAILPPGEGDAAVALHDVLSLPVVARASAIGLAHWRLTRDDWQCLTTMPALPRCDTLWLPRIEPDTRASTLEPFALVPWLRELRSLGNALGSPHVGGGWLERDAYRLVEKHGAPRWLRTPRRAMSGRTARALKALGLYDAMFEPLTPVGWFAHHERWTPSDPRELQRLESALERAGYRPTERAQREARHTYEVRGRELTLIEWSDAPVQDVLDRLAKPLPPVARTRGVWGP